MRFVLTCAVLAASVVAVSAQPEPTSTPIDPLYRQYDQLLDLYVRDGFVYYNAVRGDRSRLDQFIAALNSPAAMEHARGSGEQQKAFWINAYNALVLRTVIDHFPIKGRAAEYPAASIRQIPGAFEKATHRVAGKTLSLDAIEKEILAPLGDPRVFLALGRGAYGGGRLRSEAYDPSKLAAQLDAIAAESLTRGEIARIDVAANTVSISPLFSWRDAAFAAALADKADAKFKQRSPLERAVLALLEPHLKGAEADLLEKNAFQVQFHAFDWRLNDLSNRVR